MVSKGNYPTIVGLISGCAQEGGRCKGGTAHPRNVEGVRVPQVVAAARAAGGAAPCQAAAWSLPGTSSSGARPMLGMHGLLAAGGATPQPVGWRHRPPDRAEGAVWSRIEPRFEATTFKAPRLQRHKRAASDSARLGNCSVTDQGEFNRKLSWQGAKSRTPRRPMRDNERQTQHEDQPHKPLHATELPKACWSRICKCVILKIMASISLNTDCFC